MPHGGGGGSHSGGHSGGHHSSHSSHSSSHSSSSSGKRISNTYFRGAHRYVYYYNRSPHVYYGTERDNNVNARRLTGFIFLFIGIIWAVLGFTLPFAMAEYRKGGALQRDYDDTIVIEDSIGIIGDADRLDACLEAFLEKTGISIAVIANTTSDAEMGADIEKKAYNAYVSRWDDEKHWLIYYVGDSKDRSDDFSWYLMAGDDCVTVLSYGQEESFTAELHRYFVANKKYAFEEAVIKAIDNLKPNLKGGWFFRRGTTVNGEAAVGGRATAVVLPVLLIFGVGGILFLAVGLVLCVLPDNEEKKARAKAVETPDAESELKDAKCEYCGGIYFIGTVTSCPHCGAVLPLSSEAIR